MYACRMPVNTRLSRACHTQIAPVGVGSHGAARTCSCGSIGCVPESHPTHSTAPNTRNQAPLTRTSLARAPTTWYQMRRGRMTPSSAGSQNQDSTVSSSKHPQRSRPRSLQTHQLSRQSPCRYLRQAPRSQAPHLLCQQCRVYRYCRCCGCLVAAVARAQGARGHIRVRSQGTRAAPPPHWPCLKWLCITLRGLNGHSKQGISACTSTTSILRGMKGGRGANRTKRKRTYTRIHTTWTWARYSRQCYDGASGCW